MHQVQEPESEYSESRKRLQLHQLNARSVEIFRMGLASVGQLLQRHSSTAREIPLTHHGRLLTNLGCRKQNLKGGTRICR